jgi:hypothetical protein
MKKLLKKEIEERIEMFKGEMGGEPNIFKCRIVWNDTREEEFVTICIGETEEEDDITFFNCEDIEGFKSLLCDIAFEEVERIIDEDRFDGLRDYELCENEDFTIVEVLDMDIC